MSDYGDLSSIDQVYPPEHPKPARPKRRDTQPLSPSVMRKIRRQQRAQQRDADEALRRPRPDPDRSTP